MKLLEYIELSCDRQRFAALKALAGCVLLAVGVLPAAAVNKSWNTVSGVWSAAAHWSPLGEPLPLDGAFIGNAGVAANGTVSLDHDETIAVLQITDGMILDTNAFLLNVDGNTLVSGSNTLPSGDVFDSRMRIDAAPGWSFITEDFALSDGARVNLNGGAEIYVSGQLRLNAAADTVQLIGDGQVRLAGGGTNLINDGIIKAGAGVGLFFDQTLAGEYDLDGISGNGVLNLNSVGAKLRLQGVGLADAFSGEIRMASESDLYMQLDEPWTIDANGQVDVTGVSGSSDPAVIRGAALQFGGQLTVDGTSGRLEVRTPVVVQPTADVLVRLGDWLNFNPLNGETTVEGGNFELLNSASLVFDGPTTVEGGTFDIATDATVEFNDETTLKGGVFETVDDDFADGFVSFDGATDWRGTLTFVGAARQVGPATVSAPTVINAEMFDLDGGGTEWDIDTTLVINATATGTTPADAVGGVINIGGTLGRLTLNLTGDTQAAWAMLGTLNLYGLGPFFGTRLAGAPLLLLGAMNVNLKVEVLADLITMPTSVVNFTAPTSELRLRGETSLREGTIYNGQGTLINGLGGELTLYHTGSLADVGLFNQGLLRSRRYGAANLCAVSSMDWFTNEARGTWRVRIGGYVPGEGHDLLIVSGGAATLGGTLEVEIFDAGGTPFTPEIGDEFTILTALGGVSGTFLNSPQSCSGGAGYQWTVLYGTNDVRVRLDAIGPIPGDMNCDCQVNFADINRFVTAVSQPGGVGWPYDCPWLNADCNGDGDVTFTDINPFVALLVGS
jgi:hypothetical protein